MQNHLQKKRADSRSSEKWFPSLYDYFSSYVTNIWKELWNAKMNSNLRTKRKKVNCKPCKYLFLTIFWRRWGHRFGSRPERFEGLVNLDLIFWHFSPLIFIRAIVIIMVQCEFSTHRSRHLFHILAISFDLFPLNLRANFWFRDEFYFPTRNLFSERLFELIQLFPTLRKLLFRSRHQLLKRKGLVIWRNK